VEFDVLPAVSSAFNVASTVLLVVGWRRIRRKDVEGHRRAMLTALCTSGAFLVLYLVHHSVHPWIHRCGAEGAAKVAYQVILTSHTILAAAIAFLAPRVAWLGVKGRLDSHRRLARVTLPIWIYVSVTGVVVYVMAYHLWPVARGS
jgi:uncharacterized membrane protein YozB (DUF420 family)